MTAAAAARAPRIPPPGEDLEFVRNTRTGTIHIPAWTPRHPWDEGWTEPQPAENWGTAFAEWLAEPGRAMLCGYRLKFGYPGLPGELAGGDDFADGELCAGCVRALGDQQWRAFHVDNRGGQDDG